MQLRPTSCLIQCYRLLRLGLHLVCGFLIVATYLNRLPQPRRQRQMLRWSRQALGLLAIRVEVMGALPDPSVQKTLFVANHITWIDIWAIKSRFPLHFVAKSEIRGWPLLGRLAHATDTIFIERHRRHATGKAVAELRQALEHNENLCFFPEGTTTDGTELKAFKPSLLQAAIDASATVQPLAIRYTHPDGSCNTAVAYHGETTLLQSLRAVLKQRNITVQLIFAPPIAAAGQQRRQLAQQARSAIAALLHLPPHKALDTPAYPPDAAP